MAESEASIISQIINSEEVIQHFGYWPDFHDAEITKATFETHPTGRYSVTFVIAAFEMTSEVDERGYYKLIKHCDVEFQFIGIEEIDFKFFSFQNVLFGLEFEAVGNNIKCLFDSSVGLEVAIVAEEICILRLTPTTPIQDEPLKHIDPNEPMDAKNIFISSEHRLRNFDWSEMIYIGLDHEQANEYQTDKVASYAHSLFDEPEVYVVIGRHDSHLSTLEEALKKVSTLMRTTDVYLCNTSFTKAMKFNMIGVMSYGQKRS
ncbi:Imm50 family immunity protein [Hymenobacter arizonensis]|uniref:Immunity protein 50 n=1 Tax=Hymenobacter arizonensis TaxID=1227077 RepID=A0A1I6A8G3_HYMAR|nr:Imm50 family immunity protein [Hymenobacter arizonensis]SFQ64935.1 Immunity protein 50 [Hymenobacter arizonensis]